MFRLTTTFAAGILGLVSLAAPALACPPACAPSYGCYSCGYAPCYSACYSPCYGYRSAPVFGFEGPGFIDEPFPGAPAQRFVPSNGNGSRPQVTQSFSSPVSLNRSQAGSIPQNLNRGQINTSPGGSVVQEFQRGPVASIPQNIGRSPINTSPGGRVIQGFQGGNGLAQIPQNQGRAGVDTTPNGQATQRFNIVAPTNNSNKPPVTNSGARVSNRRR
jgi:hypothetical protein